MKDWEHEHGRQVVAQLFELAIGEFIRKSYFTMLKAIAPGKTITISLEVLAVALELTWLTGALLLERNTNGRLGKMKGASMRSTRSGQVEWHDNELSTEKKLLRLRAKRQLQE